jgi:alkanesulfonate monooxygenase SsuD/methylene tetrahydromethanopterin reductase-like flavin-dependent oxidoreductase (luciferase family)
MLALAKTPADMKALRKDMDERLIKHGRKPQDLKILFMTVPYLAETERDAQERFDRFDAAKKDPQNIEKRLWYMSYVSGGVIDYSKYDLDGPVPREVGNGETTTAKAWLEGSETITLRQLAEGPSNYGMDFIGTSDSIAAQMGEVMEEAGGDGFLMYPDVTRRSITEVCDGLAPALRKRGLIRDGYAHKTFRENLLDF